MDYNVVFRVEGFYTWHGKALNKELAKEFAKNEIKEINFGELEDFECNVEFVEIDKE